MNTVNMTIYFSGRALGSWLASNAWTCWEDNGVFLIALCFIALAAIIDATRLRDPAISKVSNWAMGSYR